MSNEGYHSHPIGLRFVKREASNKEAVNMTQYLVKKNGIRSNGWHSWMDVSDGSSDNGLWVLFNVHTGDTYLEKR